jgi:CRISPR-associated protein Cmr1
MKRITATFKIVTPMFLGDADQKATSIRPPSIKGALRFWWRALNWKEAVKEHPKNEDKALQWLNQEEARLFGSAADDKSKTSGQGIFLLNVDAGNLQKYNAGNDPFNNTPAIQYLLGLGLWHFRNKLLREALKENQTFSVTVLFKSNASEGDIKSISNAIALFGLIGGLGSRMRRGMGSVCLKSVETKNVEFPIDLERINSFEAYKQALHSIIEDLRTINAARFTAFTKDTRIEKVASATAPSNILKQIGNEMQLYRSYGRNGKVNGKNAERNFINDHDNVQKLTLQRPPKRSVFGLPHNYYFSSTRMKVEINAYFNNIEARRASPLFLHVHELNNNEFIGIHTLMPVLFLPQNAQIKVKINNMVRQTLNPDVDYDVIKTYLNRFNGERIL